MLWLFKHPIAVCLWFFHYVWCVYIINIKILKMCLCIRRQLSTKMCEYRGYINIIFLWQIINILCHSNHFKCQLHHLIVMDWFLSNLFTRPLTLLLVVWGLCHTAYSNLAPFKSLWIKVSVKCQNYTCRHNLTCTAILPMVTMVQNIYWLFT